MQATVVNIFFLFACLLIPFEFLVWPRFPTKPKSLFLRLLVVVLVGWVLLATSGHIYQNLWFREIRNTGKTPDWDPAFTMMVTIYFGWLLVLTTSVPFLILRGIVNILIKSRSCREIREIESAESGR